MTREINFSSIGFVSSAPYAMENGVSRVAVLIVVRIVHSTWGSINPSTLGDIKLSHEGIFDSFVDSFNQTLGLRMIWCGEVLLDFENFIEFSYFLLSNCLLLETNKSKMPKSSR